MEKNVNIIEMDLRAKYRMSGVCRSIGEVASPSVRILCQAVSYIERRFAAARLLRLWVRIPPGGGGGHGYIPVVNIVCCQLEVSCDRLITRPEESYRLWCVVCL